MRPSPTAVRRRARLVRAALFATAALAGVQSVRADPYYYNSLSGTWDSAAMWTKGNAPQTHNVPGSGDSAYIGNGGGTSGAAVTLRDSRSVDSLVLFSDINTNSANGPVTSPASLVLDTNGVLTVRALYVGGGSGSSASQPSGFVTRSGGRFAGLSDVEVRAGGLLNIAAADTFATTPEFIVGGGGAVLDYANSGSVGIVSLSSGGTFNLSGGVLHTKTLQVAQSATVTRNGGLLDVQQNLTLAGGSTLSLVSGDHLSGNVLVGQASKLAFASGQTVAVDNFTVQDGGSVDRSGGGTVTVTEFLTVSGGSIFALGANDNFTTAEVIPEGGTVDLNGQTLTAATLAVGNGTAGTVARTGGGTLSVASLIVQAGSTLALAAGDHVTGDVSVLPNSTLAFAAGQNLSALTSFTVNGGTVDRSRGGTFTAAGLTVTGGSTLNLASGDQLSGNVLVDQGSTLKFAAGQTVAVDNFTVQNAGAVDRSAGGDLTATVLLVSTGSTFPLGMKDALTTVYVDHTGTLDLAGHTLTATSLGIGLNNQANETPQVARTGGGTIALSGTLTVANSSAFTLSTGDVVADVSTSNGGFVVLGGGTVRAATTANTLFAASADLRVGAGGVTIDTADRDITTDASLTTDGTADGGLTKVGTGTLSLRAASTYAGPTVVAAGTLRANNPVAASPNDSATGTGAVTVRSGATLAGTGTVAGPVSIESGGTITVGTAGDAIGSTLTTGAQTWAGNASGGGYVTRVAAAMTANAPPVADQLVMSGLTIPASAAGPFMVTATGNSGTLPVGQRILIATDQNTSAPTATNPFAAAIATGRLVLNQAGSSGITPADGYVLGLAADTDSGGGYELYLADVAAPEPTSLVLTAAVAAPLGVRRRRRRPD